MWGQGILGFPESQGPWHSREAEAEHRDPAGTWPGARRSRVFTGFPARFCGGSC